MGVKSPNLMLCYPNWIKDCCKYCRINHLHDVFLYVVAGSSFALDAFFSFFTSFTITGASVSNTCLWWRPKQKNKLHRTSWRKPHSKLESPIVFILVYPLLVLPFSNWNKKPMFWKAFITLDLRGFVKKNRANRKVVRCKLRWLSERGDEMIANWWGWCLLERK